MASESRAWREVQDLASELKGSINPSTREIATRLNQLAREMRAQLVEGVHENPALAIVGNPGKSRRRAASDWSDRVYAIQYKHKGDGKQYEHEFEAGACLRANADGTVTIYRKDGRPVWDEF